MASEDYYNLYYNIKIISAARRQLIDLSDLQARASRAEDISCDDIILGTKAWDQLMGL